MKKRMFCFILCLSLLLGVFSFNVSGAEERTILSIGDSISTGYRLASPEKEGFAFNIGKENDIHVNKAIDGNTAEGILKQLDGKESSLPITEEDISKADIITMTCGGNDLMHLLYEKVVTKWNAANPDKLISKEQMKDAVDKYGVSLLQIIMGLLNSTSEEYIINDPDFSVALNNFEKNLKSVVSHLSSVNPDVKIIIATQYNPYMEFKGNILANAVYAGIEDGLGKLNEVITKNAKKSGYVVADVKKAFDEYKGGEDLYNADIKTMEIDFHPTSAGHAVIKDTFNSLINADNTESTDSSESTEQSAKYKVTYSYEELNGTFTQNTEEYEALVGETVTAEIKDVEGFIKPEFNAEQMQGVVTEDGNLELSVQYKRDVFVVYWHTDGAVISNNCIYGAEIKSPFEDDPTKEGHIFKGWDIEIPSTMPAHDITFTAKWEKVSTGDSDASTGTDESAGAIDVASGDSSSAQGETEGNAIIIFSVIGAILVIAIIIVLALKKKDSKSK